MRGPTLKLTGRRIKKLVVIAKSEKPSYWRCRCDCGTIKDVRGGHLQNSSTTRCGCSKRVKGRTSGGHLSPTYQSWKVMKARCNNKKQSAYGGRGVNYDPRWDKFQNFLADMGERPLGTTLDRIEPLGDYTRWNCQWGTLEDRARNKRRTEFIVATPPEPELSETDQQSRLALGVSEADSTGVAAPFT